MESFGSACCAIIYCTAKKTRADQVLEIYALSERLNSCSCRGDLLNSQLHNISLWHGLALDFITHIYSLHFARLGFEAKATRHLINHADCSELINQADIVTSRQAIREVFTYHQLAVFQSV